LYESSKASSFWAAPNKEEDKKKEVCEWLLENPPLIA
jgi:hypothetical protein